jgi:hypothetical protein
MKTTIIDTLIARKECIMKELEHINGLLDIYTSQEIDGSSKGGLEKNNTKILIKKTSKVTNKDYILDIISKLGGSASVKQVYDEFVKLNEGTNIKSIHNTVRNYIHILKKEGILEAENIEGTNKFIYMIKK